MLLSQRTNIRPIHAYIHQYTPCFTRPIREPDVLTRLDTSPGITVHTTTEYEPKTTLLRGGLFTQAVERQRLYPYLLVYAYINMSNILCF